LKTTRGKLGLGAMRITGFKGRGRFLPVGEGGGGGLKMADETSDFQGWSHAPIRFPDRRGNRNGRGRGGRRKAIGNEGKNKRRSQSRRGGEPVEVGGRRFVGGGSFVLCWGFSRNPSLGGTMHWQCGKTTGQAFREDYEKPQDPLGTRGKRTDRRAEKK